MGRNGAEARAAAPPQMRNENKLRRTGQRLWQYKWRIGVSGLALTGLAACTSSSTGGVPSGSEGAASSAVSPGSMIPSAGSSVPEVSGSSGMPSAGSSAPETPPSSASSTPETPLYTVPSASGEGVNNADCITDAPEEAPAPPGPQLVNLTANSIYPGLTFVKDTDFTAVNSDGKTEVVVDQEDQRLTVKKGSLITQQPLHGDPVIVVQRTSGNNFIPKGEGAPATACGVEPGAVSTFKQTASQFYKGEVTIVTMTPNAVSVRQGSM